MMRYKYNLIKLLFEVLLIYKKLALHLLYTLSRCNIKVNTTIGKFINVCDDDSFL